MFGTNEGPGGRGGREGKGHQPGGGGLSSDAFAWLVSDSVSVSA